MLIAVGAHLKARRAWTRDNSNGQSANNILQRIPAIILDTRLNDTQNKETYMCDECETVFHGPFQGELTKEARHLSYEDLSTGWKHGTVDASWFCVDCWADTLKSTQLWAPLLLRQYCYTGASCKNVFFRDAWRHRIKREVLSQLSVLKLQGRCPTKGQKVHTLTGFSYFAGHCESLADQG